eukprot:1608742-Pleurochrysis_carterae.AAC.1
MRKTRLAFAICLLDGRQAPRQSADTVAGIANAVLNGASLRDLRAQHADFTGWHRRIWKQLFVSVGACFSALMILTSCLKSDAMAACLLRAFSADNVGRCPITQRVPAACRARRH